MKSSKNYRVLQLYVWLEEGRCINIIQAANEFQVDVRTVQRDIADIRAFLAEDLVRTGFCRKVVYDKNRNGYRIVPWKSET